MPSGTPPEQIQPGSLNDYLEVMSKAVFQSGMSWRVVEAKWSGTREAFHDFDVAQVAAFDERDIDALTKDTRVIRNYRKLNAIVSNAQTMIALDE
ncbi:MAG TPA: DNA-3-methyladenine glycosylase I [Anaerolineales bacterium]|jgi:3-methyladenine DNA glycosylase Tag|nr:DNA-3-methyladenine glycosylase I [Anaerolineales bacterium]